MYAFTFEPEWHGMRAEVRETCGSQFSSPVLVGLGIKRRSSVLAAGTSPTEPSLGPHSLIFKWWANLIVLNLTWFGRNVLFYLCVMEFNLLAFCSRFCICIHERNWLVIFLSCTALVSFLESYAVSWHELERWFHRIDMKLKERYRLFKYFSQFGPGLWECLTLRFNFFNRHKNIPIFNFFLCGFEKLWFS